MLANTLGARFDIRRSLANAFAWVMRPSPANTPPPLIRDRVRAAAEQIRLKQTTPKPPGTIRPNAKRFAGPHAVKDYSGTPWEFSVRLSTTPPVGWLYGVTLEPGRGQIKPEHVRWIGDRSRDGRGYATSTEAYSALMSKLNPKD